jgi:hypothetical protein
MAAHRKIISHFGTVSHDALASRMAELAGSIPRFGQCLRNIVLLLSHLMSGIELRDNDWDSF